MKQEPPATEWQRDAWLHIRQDAAPHLVYYPQFQRELVQYANYPEGRMLDVFNWPKATWNYVHQLLLANDLAYADPDDSFIQFKDGHRVFLPVTPTPREAMSVADCGAIPRS